jgi:hypothetical protein
MAVCVWQAGLLEYARPSFFPGLMQVAAPAPVSMPAALPAAPVTAAPPVASVAPVLPPAPALAVPPLQQPAPPQVGGCWACAAPRALQLHRTGYVSPRIFRKPQNLSFVTRGTGAKRGFMISMVVNDSWGQSARRSLSPNVERTTVILAKRCTAPIPVLVGLPTGSRVTRVAGRLVGSSIGGA